MADGIIEVEARLKDHISGELAKITNSINDFGNKSKAAAGESSMSFTKLAGAFGIATTATGLLSSGVSKLSAFLDECNQAGLEASEAQFKLDASLQASGRDVPVTQFTAWNNTLKESTVRTDDELQSAEAMALQFKGIATKEIPDVIKVASGMAHLFGGSLKEKTFELGRILEDPQRGLRMLRSEGVYLTAQQEDLIKSLEASGDKAAAAAIIFDRLKQQFLLVDDTFKKSSIGQYTEQQNALNEIEDKVGKDLIPIRIAAQTEENLAIELGVSYVYGKVQEIKNLIAVWKGLKTEAVDTAYKMANMPIPFKFPAPSMGEFREYEAKYAKVFTPPAPPPEKPYVEPAVIKQTLESQKALIDSKIAIAQTGYEKFDYLRALEMKRENLEYNGKLTAYAGNKKAIANLSEEHRNRILSIGFKYDLEEEKAAEKHTKEVMDALARGTERETAIQMRKFETEQSFAKRSELLGKVSLAKDLTMLEQEHRQELMDDELTTQQKTIIDKEYHDKKKQLVLDSATQSADNAAANLKTVATQWEEAKGVYKAFAYAAAAMDTYKAANAAYASAAAIPVVGFVLGPIAAAAAIAAGLANINEISKFAQGGIVSGSGSSISDMIPAYLSSGEAVLNANAVNVLGPAGVNALNSGATIGSITASPTIVIQGNADPRTVKAIGQELDRFVRMLELGFRSKKINPARLTGMATV
jgi:hypothetical protein